jgi:hypothetical protein
MEFDGRQAASPAGSLIGRIISVIVAAPFAVIGVLIVWRAIQYFQAGTIGQGLVFFAFGLIFAAIGFGLMFATITAERRRKAIHAKWDARTDGGRKPWLVRDDWAAGKIKSTAGAQWKFLLVVGVIFTGITGAISVAAIPSGLAHGKPQVLFALIFPLIGLGILIVAARAWQARRRFGDCFFEPAQVPALLGGSLDGVILISVPITLEDNLYLKLSCLCRTVSGSGKERTAREDVLWDDEKVLRQDAGLSSTSAGGSEIPVHFRLPSNQPESVPRGNPAITWRLAAKSKMRGPNFGATFEVPVFRAAGAAKGLADIADDETDPTAPMQLSAEEIRRDEHSRIQVTDGPNGREFYFPAARNPGYALALTAVLIVWSGFLWLMTVKHAPILFPIVFGLFEIMLVWGCFNVWIKSSRVTVNTTEVTIQSRWFILGRTRRVAAGDVAGFVLKIGTTSGSTTFHDIKFVLRANQAGITVASDIASEPETEWLVSEMNRALGRKI